MNYPYSGAGQIGLNTPTISTTGYANIEPKAPARLDAVAGHFDSNLTGLHETLKSVNILADRLGGAVPTPAQKGEAGNIEQQPNSALKLERIAGYQSAVIQEINQTIQRLNQL